MAAVMEADIRPPSLKLAALAMANFLNDSTGQLNPSMDRVARACGLSEVQARRQVHLLIAQGLLSVVGNQNGGSPGSSRQYRLHLDRLPETPLMGDSPTPLASETPLASDRALTSDRDPSHGRARPLSLASETPLASETLTRKEPRKNQEGNQERRERATSPTCPTDVDQQTWTDWLQLRKAKRAPVTGTVVNGARQEADKAGMTLDSFLQVWCMRGSQGLQADWLKPHERQTQSRVTFADHDEQNRRRKWPSPRPTSHHGLASKDYTEGVTADGSLI